MNSWSASMRSRPLPVWIFFPAWTATCSAAWSPSRPRIFGSPLQGSVTNEAIPHVRRGAVLYEVLRSDGTGPPGQRGLSYLT